jgi:hypothetical protein
MVPLLWSQPMTQGKVVYQFDQADKVGPASRRSFVEKTRRDRRDAGPTKLKLTHYPGESVRAEKAARTERTATSSGRQT